MSAFNPTTAQRKFVAVLAKLTAPLDAERAGQALMDMLPALNTLPPGVFCDAAAEHVARNAQFGFPSYGALRKMLELWWAVNEPKGAADRIGTGDTTLDADDLGWLRNWQRHKDAGFPEISAATDLRLARQYRPRAFAYLLRTDTHAAEVAVLNGWSIPGQRPMPDADEIAHVERMGEDARAAIAKAAHGITAHDERQRSVKQQVDALAPTQDDIDRAAAAFEARHGRKPGELSPEQLAELRKSNPVLQHALAKTKPADTPRSMWDPLPNAKAGDVEIVPIPNAKPGDVKIAPLDNAPAPAPAAADPPPAPPANDRAPQRAAAAATPPAPAIRFPWHDDEVVP